MSLRSHWRFAELSYLEPVGDFVVDAGHALHSFVKGMRRLAGLESCLYCATRVSRSSMECWINSGSIVARWNWNQWERSAHQHGGIFGPGHILHDGPRRKLKEELYIDAKREQ